MPIDDGPSSSAGPLPLDEDALQPDKAINTKSSPMEDAFHDLTERQRFVLTRRYGLDDGESAPSAKWARR